MIATVLAHASQAIVDGKTTDPFFLGRKRNGDALYGIDLGLYWLAAGARACPHEPVFPLYRAAFSVDHPRMSSDKKLEQVRLATAAIEEASQTKLYNHRLGSETELKLIAHMVVFSRTASEYYLGTRLIDAAQPYFTKDKTVLPRLREHLEMLRNPKRSDRLLAPLPPALGLGAR